MKNREIADIFTHMADILEFKGESPFKVNAYRKGARVLEDLTDDLETLAADNKLGEIPGIGKALQGKIEDYLKNGSIHQYDELLNDIPGDLFKLLQIPGFGPKTAALAWEKLKIGTLTELDQAIQSGELAKLPGMGEKRVENIRKGVELQKTASERLSIGLAVPIVDHVIEYLREQCGDRIEKITVAGSTRRGRETVHDIDLLAVSNDGPDIIATFTKIPNTTQVLGSGNTKGSIIYNDQVQIDLRVVPAESYGAAMQYFTGSQAHNVKLRGIAKAMGYKINEYGIYKGEEQVGGSTEKEIYEQLNMDWIPPEMREDRGEIELAQRHDLPDLIKDTDMQADLHIHSKYSDGQLTVAEMAQALQEFGYHFMAITDHSQSAFYANGLDRDRLFKQIDEVRELNEKNPDFTILAGTEVDILPNGDLDFPDDLLEKLDFVVASIHSAFTTDPTNRTLNAMRNPYVDVIGHPSGRLISRREGFQLDYDAIFETALSTGTALEVNAYWDRLDLSDIRIQQAVSKGVKISINTDSHHTHHLGMMRFGIATARRGWATPNDVINTLSLPELRKWQKRSRI